MTYVFFYCGSIFFPETPKKVTSNEKGITFPDPVKKPCAFPATINITAFFDEQYTSNIFLNPYKLWDMVPATPLCHSITLLMKTLCPISNLNQQLTYLEQTHIRCSFHCERWTVKGRDCASGLSSFKEITYRTDG